MAHSAVVRQRVCQIINSNVKCGRLVGLLLAGSLMIGESPALAQITPDQSLGAESSRVTPRGTLQNGRRVNQRIDGGATRGSNLFHSFNEFNVRSGEQVYFQNPNGIENIFSRVTGSDVSDILGTLGVDGSANLFLLNPNGIVFGANAWLDLRGSFLATTAEGLVFPDGFTFSARNPQTPPLLTVNVPIGLQYGSSPGAIAVNDAVLSVDSGQSLILAGGEVTVDNALLATIDRSTSAFPADGGRIELGSVAGAGNIGLNVADNVRLDFANPVVRSDISLINGSTLDVIADNRGDIAIYAQNFQMMDGSELQAGIAAGLGSVGNRSGDIVVNATGDVNLTGEGTVIRNALFAGAIGNAGDIEIRSNSLRIADQAQLSTSTSGQGNAGNITIRGGAFVADNAGIFGNIRQGGNGRGGRITIEAGNVQLQNGTELQSSVLGASEDAPAGQGVGGDIVLLVDGIASITRGRIFTDLEEGTTGQAGNIRIRAGSLSLTNGGLLNSDTSGRGNAGAIELAAGTINLNNSTISSNIARTGVGNAGTIDLRGSDRVTLSDGARLSSSTFGQGNAGDITIRGSNFVADNATIFNNIEAGGNGRGGRITIEAGNVQLQNNAQLQSSVIGVRGDRPAGQGIGGDVVLLVDNTVNIAGGRIFTDLEEGTIGGAGNIRIRAGSLSLIDGGRLNSDTSGRGNAGTIDLTAGTINLNNSRIYSDVNSTAIGQGGQIRVASGSLSLSDGAIVSTDLYGQGNAGTIELAAGTINLNNSTISSNIARTGVGNAGTIDLRGSDRVTLSDGARLSSSTFGQGNAGDITIRGGEAAVTLSGNNTVIFSNIEAGGNGRGGRITIEAGNVQLQNNAQLQSSVIGVRGDRPAGQGIGGDVVLLVDDTVNIAGGRIFTNLEEGTIGGAGNIRIRAGSLSLIDGGLLNSDTSGRGNAGTIDLTAGTINLNNSRIYSDINSMGVGQGGRIRVASDSLSLSDGAIVSTDLYGQGNAGTIELSADKISVNNSRIYSDINSTGTGQGGQIRVTSDSLSLSDRARVSTDLYGQGNAGAIEIMAGDRVFLSGDARFSSSTFSLGNAGDITIRSNAVIGDNAGIFSNIEAGGNGRGGRIAIEAINVQLQNGTQLQSSVNSASENSPAGQGIGGDVVLSVSGAVTIAGSNSAGQVSGIFTDLEEGASGQAGSMRINAGSVSIANGGRLNADTSGAGNAGTINIRAIDRVLLTGEVVIESSTYGQGRAGSIGIIAGDRVLLLNGAQISTTSFSQGSPGNIVINAGNGVLLRGTGSSGFSSAIFTDSQGEGGRGGEGSITVHAPNVQITDGAVIDARTTNARRGGSITINARTFAALHGGQVITTTQGEGWAGNIELNIADSLMLSGVDTSYPRRLERFGRGRIANEVNNGVVRSGLFATTRRGSTGDGGSIRVNADTAIVQDGARISVDSRGSGEGGNIQMQMGSLSLDRSVISAETTSNTGGDITLNLEDFLRLRNGSRISATAGINQSAGDGGNITINAPSGFIIAPLGDNDIVANAFRGRGGNIQISSQGIFGFAERRSTPNNGSNDIDASSEFGTSGTVTLNTPIDPAQGLLQLPENVLDAANQIARTCPSGVTASTAPSRFVATGRGGLPPNPGRSLGSDDVQVEWYSPDRPTDSTLQDAPEPSPENSSSGSSSGSLNGSKNGSLNGSLNDLSNAPLIEAQGLQVAASGEIQLVAPSQTASLPNPAFAGCTP